MSTYHKVPFDYGTKSKKSITKISREVSLEITNETTKAKASKKPNKVIRKVLREVIPYEYVEKLKKFQ